MPSLASLICLEVGLLGDSKSHPADTHSFTTVPSGYRAVYRSNQQAALWGWDENIRSQIQDRDITENMLTPVGIRKRTG